jgi:hypothetical protein
VCLERVIREKLFLAPTVLGFAAISLAGQADVRPAGELGVRLSGELLATLSAMAARGVPLVVPIEYTGGAAMNVKTATWTGRATNSVAGGDGQRYGYDRY